MSSIHDQAMHHIYKQVLQRLLENMSQAQRASLQLLIQRLLVAAGGANYIGQFQLLVVHGTDRRSATLLACLRAAQLSIAQRGTDTFRLKVMVATLPVAGREALEQYERSFSTLFLQHDPRVELLMLQGQAVVPFCPRSGGSSDPWAQTRDSLLLFGHLTGGRPESLFGSRLHLQLADAFRQALGQVDGSGALVIAIPERQRRVYLAWSRRCLRLAGESGAGAHYLCPAVLTEALARLHERVADPLTAPATAASAAGVDRALSVIAVDDLLQDRGDASPVERMLDARLEFGGTAPLASCFDPAAVLHLRQLHGRLARRRRGVKALRLGLRTRDVGGLSQVPEPLKTHLLHAMGLTEKQLICLLFAPFADHGRGLVDFVQTCHPGMEVALPYLHRALQGKSCPDGVRQWLVEVSGLNLVQLKAIYGRQVGQPARRILATLARRDLSLSLLVGERIDH